MKVSSTLQIQQKMIWKPVAVYLNSFRIASVLLWDHEIVIRELNVNWRQKEKRLISWKLLVRVALPMKYSQDSPATFSTKSGSDTTSFQSSRLSSHTSAMPSYSITGMLKAFACSLSSGGM